MTPTGTDPEAASREHVIVLRPGEQLVVVTQPAPLMPELSGDGRRHHALKIAALMDCSLTELAEILHRSPGGLRRRPEGNAALQRRLVRLASLATLVIQSTNLNYFRAWLRAPVPALGYRRPIDILKTEGGTEDLADTVEGMLSGVFS